MWLLQLDGNSKVIYEQVFTGNPAVKLLVDPGQGSILDANPAALRFYGYEHEAVTRLRLVDIEILPRHDASQSPVNPAAHYISVHRTAAGEVRDVEVYAGDIDLQQEHLRYLLVHDITRQPTEVPAYRDLADRFRAIFQHAGIGIGLVDMAGHLLESNPAFQRFLGYDAVELQTMQFLDFTHPQDAPRNWQLFTELVEGRQDAFQLEKRYVGKEGRVVWGRVTVSLIWNREADLDRYAIILVEDISERKQMEEALHHLNDSLEQQVAQRTAELAEANSHLQELDRLKSRFVENVSHELRTPLTSLKTYLHLLSQGKTERYEQYLGVMKSQMERLAHLVDDLLNLARLEGAGDTISSQPVDLAGVVRASVEAQKARAEAKGLALRLEFEADALPVRGDRELLRQIASNLISNALSYTEQGEIRVRLWREAHTGQAGLQVADTGRGILDEDLPYIFDRFYRGRLAHASNVPGTGLGLSIVKEAVELHGGLVTVDSTPGAGSVFTVRLPLAEQGG